MVKKWKLKLWKIFKNFLEKANIRAYKIVGGNLTYNKKTNDFTFYLSIYHASEDNNAENVDYHTDEEEYSFDTIEEVCEYISTNINNAKIFLKASRSMKFERIIELLK